MGVGHICDLQSIQWMEQLNYLYMDHHSDMTDLAMQIYQSLNHIILKTIIPKSHSRCQIYVNRNFFYIRTTESVTSIPSIVTPMIFLWFRFVSIILLQVEIIKLLTKNSSYFVMHVDSTDGNNNVVYEENSVDTLTPMTSKSVISPSSTSATEVTD